MTTTAEGLIDTIVAILQVSPPPTAAAAADVQPYRDWSITTLAGPFGPKITFDLPKEEKESVGPAGPANFNVTAIITLRAFVSAKSGAAAGSDGGEVRVRQAISALRRQIEIALVNAPTLMGQIKQIKGMRSETRGAKDSNGVHLAELSMQIMLEFYQGAEDFNPFTADDFDVFHLDGADSVSAAGFELDFTPPT